MAGGESTPAPTSAQVGSRPAQTRGKKALRGVSLQNRQRNPFNDKDGRQPNRLCRGHFCLRSPAVAGKLVAEPDVEFLHPFQVGKWPRFRGGHTIRSVQRSCYSPKRPLKNWVVSPIIVARAQRLYFQRLAPVAFGGLATVFPRSLRVGNNRGTPPITASIEIRVRRKVGQRLENKGLSNCFTQIQCFLGRQLESYNSSGRQGVSYNLSESYVQHHRIPW